MQINTIVAYEHCCSKCLAKRRTVNRVVWCSLTGRSIVWMDNLHKPEYLKGRTTFDPGPDCNYVLEMSILGEQYNQ